MTDVEMGQKHMRNGGSLNEGRNCSKKHTCYLTEQHA